MKPTRLKTGDVIKAKVTAIKPYGAFIETKDGQSGLIHISEITNCFIFDINTYVKVGEIVEIKVLSIKNDKINGTMNFKSKTNSKFNKKCKNSLDTLHFKYGFASLRENLPLWRKKILSEMKNKHL